MTIMALDRSSNVFLNDLVEKDADDLISKPIITVAKKGTAQPRGTWQEHQIMDYFYHSDVFLN